jgi:hypothetical protein
MISWSPTTGSSAAKTRTEVSRTMDIGMSGTFTVMDLGVSADMGTDDGSSLSNQPINDGDSDDDDNGNNGSE